MNDMLKYIRCHIVEAKPMTRGDYNTLRGWAIPANENAADEGYYIVYPDGYESWCPKAQFEAAGRLIDNMTFGQAIDACRYSGKKIQRKNWNGVGQYVEFRECATLNLQGVENHSSCFVFHFVNRKTGETGIQVGWLASQADMAADDWVIVE